MRYLVALALLVTFSHAKEANVQQLFNVQTVKVQHAPHTKSSVSYGFVKVDEARVYDISPRFGGFVESMYADKLYTKVRKGEALAKVYSPEVLKAKDDYLSTIKFSEIRPNPSMLESAKTKLELLDIPSAEIASVRKNNKVSRFTTLISPADGYLFKKSISNGSSFNAKSSIFEIVNLDKVWVELKVHQDQLALVNDVQEFKLTTPSSREIFVAKKGELYPRLDQKEESFTLRLEVANKGLVLKPGMYMSAVMSSGEKEYLTLPSTAVVRKNGKFFVFGIGEYQGEYTPKEVQVKLLNPDTYIIKSGLAEGDEVVNNALFMMDSDAQINGLY